MRWIPFLVLMLFSACSNLPEDEFALQPTELKVRVLDESFKEVKDAEVAVYRDYYSFATRTGEFAKAIVGESGFAEFTDLEPFNYYIYATYQVGDVTYENEDISYNLFDLLTENAVTTITVATQKRRDKTPTKFTFDYLEAIPLTEGSSWKTVNYDSIYGEIILIRNFDGFKNVSEQDIVARATFEQEKKQQLGFPLYFYLQGGPLEVNLDDLKYYFDEEPGKDSYSFYFSFFTKKSDFNAKEAIYKYEQLPTGKWFTEELTISNQILDGRDQNFPFPGKLYAGKTTNMNYDYQVYFNLIWE